MNIVYNEKLHKYFTEDIEVLCMNCGISLDNKEGGGVSFYLCEYFKKAVCQDCVMSGHVCSLGETSHPLLVRGRFEKKEEVRG